MTNSSLKVPLPPPPPPPHHIATLSCITSVIFPSDCQHHSFYVLTCTLCTASVPSQNPITSYPIKIQNGFTLLVPDHPSCSKKDAIKRVLPIIRETNRGTSVQYLV